MSTSNNSLSSVKNVITPASHSISRSIIRHMPTGLVGKNDLASNTNRPVCGPFRAAMNSGDVLGRKYLQCDCPNPLGSMSKSIVGGDGISQRGCGIIINGYTTKTAPVANCNPKFVYDSSDYIKYKKIQAQRLGYKNKSTANGASGGFQLSRLQRMRS